MGHWASLAMVALLSPEQRNIPRQKHCLQLCSDILWLNHSFLPLEGISVHVEEGVSSSVPSELVKQSKPQAAACLHFTAGPGNARGCFLHPALQAKDAWAGRGCCLLWQVWGLQTPGGAGLGHTKGLCCSAGTVLTLDYAQQSLGSSHKPESCSSAPSYAMPSQLTSPKHPQSYNSAVVLFSSQTFHPIHTVPSPELPLQHSQLCPVGWHVLSPSYSILPVLELLNSSVISH